MVTVVEKQKLDSHTVMVTLEGDKPSELAEKEAKDLAYAVRLEFGMAGAGISDASGAYPTETEDDKGKKIVKYRKDYKLWAGL